MMFDLSSELENFIFFDSMNVLTENPLSRNVDNILPPNDKRGVHISRRAAELIRRELVTAVELLASRWGAFPPSDKIRGWKWPLDGWRLKTVTSILPSLGERFIFHPEYKRVAMYA